MGVPAVKVGETLRVEVATGGAPAAAIVAACPPLDMGWLIDAGVQHDDDCPCLDGAALPDCTCEVLWLTLRRLA